MNFLKKFFFLLLILGAALYYVFPTYGKPYVINQIEQGMIKAAESKGVKLGIQKTDMTFSGFQLTGVSCYFYQQGFYSMVEIEELLFSPNWLKLLSGTAEVLLSGSSYGGIIKGSLDYSLKNKVTEGYLKAEDINLDKHLQLNALGVVSGKLNLNVPHFSGSLSKLEVADISLEISDLNKPQATKITAGLPLPLSIPPVTELEMAINCMLTPGNFECAKIESSSSLWTISGSGKIGLDGPPAKTPLRMELDVSLSRDGIETLGPYLPLISAGKVPSTQGIFKVSLSGTAAKPIWEVKGYQ